MKLTVEFDPQYPNGGYCEIEFDTLEFSIPDKEYELLTREELEDKILSGEYGKITHTQNDSETEKKEQSVASFERFFPERLSWPTVPRDR